MQSSQKIISNKDIISFFELLGLGTHEERENYSSLGHISELPISPEIYYTTKLSNSSEPLVCKEEEEVKGKDG